MTALVATGGPVFGKWMWVLLGLSVGQSGLAMILVALRVYDVRQSGKSWRWDLIFVSLATFCGAVMEILAGLLTGLNGLGTEQALLSPEQVSNALEWAWIGTVLWAWTLCFGKLAIVALYIHITKAAVKRERIFLWTIGCIMVAAAIVQTCLIVMSCDPPQKQWNDAIPGTCRLKVVSLNFDYFQGAFSAVTDFLLALYPIPFVIRMQCSRSTKIGVCAVMAGGLLPFAAAIGRTLELHKLLDPEDATRRWISVYIWGITEIWFVIILGSLPPLRAYFAALLRLKSESIHMDNSLQTAAVTVANDEESDPHDGYLYHGASRKFSKAGKFSKADVSKLSKADFEAWESRAPNILVLDPIHLK